MKGNRRLLAAVAAVLVAAAALVAVAAVETSDADSSASPSYLSGDLTLDSSMASSSIFVTVVDATNDTTVTIPSDVAYTGTLMFGYHAVVGKSNVDVVFDKITFNTAISDGKVVYSHADGSITVSAASETPFDVEIATGTVVFGSDGAPADGQVTAGDTVVTFEDAVGVKISVEEGGIFLAGVSDGTVDVVSGTVRLREASIDIGGTITVEKGAVLSTEASVATTYGFSSDVLTSGTVYLKDAEDGSTVVAKIEDGELQVSGLAENHVYTLVYVAATETADGEDGSTGDDADVTEVSTAEDLAKAAAAGGSAKLTARIEMTSTLEIGADVTFTLDLAGCTLTNTAADTISNRGALTVTDSLGGGRVVSATAGMGAFVNYPGATAVLKGGTYHVSSDKGWYAIKNMGEMTIEDGVTVTSNAVAEEEGGSNSSLVANGWYGDNKIDGNDRGVSKPASADGAARLTINGGAFTSNSKTSTIKNDDWSVTVINGGTFTSNKGYVIQASGTCTVNDGTFTGPSAIVTMYGVKGDTTMADPGALTVTGGTFNGAYLAESTAGTVMGYGSLAVSGGDFTLTKGVYDGNKDGIALLTSGSSITGGTYDVPADVDMGDYLADGTNFVTVDGKTVVGQEYVVVVADGTYHVIGDVHVSGEAAAACGAYTPTVITVSGNVTVMGTFGVDATKITSSETVSYIANTLAVSGSGKIDASAAEDLRVQFDGEASLLTSGIDAAYYVAEDAEKGLKTVHYTDLDTVIKSATGAAGFVGEYTISKDTTIKASSDVNYTVNPGSTVTVDADTVTFAGDILYISGETDAQAEGRIDVTSGRLVLQGVTSYEDLGTKVSAATRVSSANADGTKYVVYTSLQVAINEAFSGQTVAMRDTVADPVVITGEATLAKGVVLDMNGMGLQIGKEGASGTVVFDGTVIDAAGLAVVNGSLALNAANTEAEGTVTYAYPFTAIDVDDGLTVGAEAEIASTVNVKGGSVAIDGTADAVAVAALDKDATIAVSDNGKLVFATLAATGDGAKLTISATGTVALPAAVSSAVDSEISVSKLSLARPTTVKNTGTMVLAVKVDGASEEITLVLASSTEGKTMDATINGTAYLGAVDINGKLVVNGASAGSTVVCAELQIAEGASLACASLEVSGNVDVAGKLTAQSVTATGEGSATTVSGTATVGTYEDGALISEGAVSCAALAVTGTMTAGDVTAVGITVGEGASLTASAVVSTDAVDVAGTLSSVTLYAIDKSVTVSGTATVQAPASTGEDQAEEVDAVDDPAVVCGSLTVTGTMTAGDVTAGGISVGENAVFNASALTVTDGAADLSGTVAVDSIAATGIAVSVNAGETTVAGDVVCAALTVTGTMTAVGVTAGGDVAVDGTLTAAYLNAAGCGVTVSGTMTVSSADEELAEAAGAVVCAALTVSGTMTAASVVASGAATVDGSLTVSYLTAAGITVGSGASLTASAVESKDAVDVAGTLSANTLNAAGCNVTVSGTATVQAAASTGDDPVDYTDLDAGDVVCAALTVTGTMTAGDIVAAGNVTVDGTLNCGTLDATGANVTVNGTVSSGDVTCSAFEVSASATSVAVGKVSAAESAVFSGPATIGGLETVNLTVGAAVESSGVVAVTGDTVVAEGGSFTLVSLMRATFEKLTVYKGATLKGSDNSITVNGAIVVGESSADFADNVYSVDVKIDFLGEVATAIIYGTANGLTMPEDAACTTLWLVNGQEDILYNTQYGYMPVALDDLSSAFEGRSGTGWYTARTGGNQIFVKDEVMVGEYSALYQQFDVKTFEILFNYYKGIDGYLVDGQFVQGGTYLTADFGTVYSSITLVASDGYDVSGCTVVPTTLTVTGNASVEVEGAPSVINDDDGDGNGSDDGLSLTEYLLIVLVIINAVLAVVVILRLMRS